VKAVAGVTITNSDKVWWPDDGITKLEIAEHYARCAGRALPWIADRPLTVERCPDGMRGHCFYQKNFANAAKFGFDTRPVYARTVRRMLHYPVAGDARTLVVLVNLGALSLHVMGCRASSLDRPDWLAFDLDPAERFADAARAALVLREVLGEAGLRGYPKTTGGKGLHVVVPLQPGPSHADVLAFAETLAERMIERAPRLVTLSFAKRGRGGRVYLDIRRNVFGATLVAPYSVRRRPHAPVSTPLTWDEVQPELDPASLNVRTLPARLAHRDPWRDASDDRQRLPTDSSARARYRRAPAAGSP